MKSKLHITMFPWFAYGHFIPFIHLSNQLAHHGHTVSFILPRSALPKLQQLTQYPDLIHFYPLQIPHDDGLPPGAETNSDITFPLVKHLISAFDLTQPQVESYLSTLRPDFVFFDFAHWIPHLGRSKFGFKSIYHPMVSVVHQAFYIIPSRRVGKNKVIVEALVQPPPGFPSPKLHLKRHEVALALPLYEESWGGLPFIERLIKGRLECDAIAVRTCYEIEGSFCDYVAKQYGKPVLLTGLALPQTPVSELEEKWANWLNQFEADSVVYCSFGSQVILEREQFQELLLGFELSGFPFLVALAPPQGCATVEEALPEGFQERVGGRGWVYGGWVPQPAILKHPNVGCFVSHCGFSSMGESLLSDCQIVLIPQSAEQFLGARLMVHELGIAAEVEREESMWVSKGKVSEAIKVVMDKESDVGRQLKSNRDKLRSILSIKGLQESYFIRFIQSLQGL